MTRAFVVEPAGVDSLVSGGRGADLLFAEAYCFERKVPFHLDYTTLRYHLAAIGAKRVVLVHMSADMLARVSEVEGCEVAEDGAEFNVE